MKMVGGGMLSANGGRRNQTRKAGVQCLSETRWSLTTFTGELASPEKRHCRGRECGWKRASGRRRKIVSNLEGAPTMSPGKGLGSTTKTSTWVGSALVCGSGGAGSPTSDSGGLRLSIRCWPPMR
ncbi:hypothetical protein L1887_35826 [Cichorium endivia]|nr:hypothetical protein L1887_35826 [Cichorium endivia]